MCLSFSPVNKLFLDDSDFLQIFGGRQRVTFPTAARPCVSATSMPLLADRCRLIALDLILDYRSNVALYPDFQSYFRKAPSAASRCLGDVLIRRFYPRAPPLISGDLSGAQIHLLHAGHFALETHVEQVAILIGELLDRVLDPSKWRT